MAVALANARGRECNAADRDVGADANTRAGQSGHCFDQGCGAAWAKADTEIAALKSEGGGAALRWADEKEVADHNRPFEWHNPPEAERFAWRHVDPQSAKPTRNETPDDRRGAGRQD